MSAVQDWCSDQFSESCFRLFGIPKSCATPPITNDTKSFYIILGFLVFLGYSESFRGSFGGLGWYLDDQIYIDFFFSLFVFLGFVTLGGGAEDLGIPKRRKQDS